jgi:hypothetical protein
LRSSNIENIKPYSRRGILSANSQILERYHQVREQSSYRNGNQRITNGDPTAGFGVGVKFAGGKKGENASYTEVQTAPKIVSLGQPARIVD